MHVFVTGRAVERRSVKLAGHNCLASSGFRLLRLPVAPAASDSFVGTGQWKTAMVVLVEGERWLFE